MRLARRWRKESRTAIPGKEEGYDVSCSAPSNALTSNKIVSIQKN
jgi:hypothetical protein